jgi:hypothetical protein
MNLVGFFEFRVFFSNFAGFFEFRGLFRISRAFSNFTGFYEFRGLFRISRAFLMNIAGFFLNGALRPPLLLDLGELVAGLTPGPAQLQPPRLAMAVHDGQDAEAGGQTGRHTHGRQHCLLRMVAAAVTVAAQVVLLTASAALQCSQRHSGERLASQMRWFRAGSQ